MTANARWTVTLQFHLPSTTGGSGDTFTRDFSLASPDLRDIAKAHRQARTTALARAKKWATKNWPSHAKRLKITVQRSRC